jgi:hypothetical protein
VWHLETPLRGAVDGQPPVDKVPEHDPEKWEPVFRKIMLK